MGPNDLNQEREKLGFPRIEDQNFHPKTPSLDNLKVKDNTPLTDDSLDKLGFQKNFFGEEYFWILNLPDVYLGALVSNPNKANKDGKYTVQLYNNDGMFILKTVQDVKDFLELYKRNK